MVEITKDDPGKVSVQVRNAKDGSTTRVECIIYDKTGKQIVQFWASSGNLRESRFYPVNIFQEECTRFGQFMTAFANEVNQENAALNEELNLQANKSAGKGSVILSIIGIIVGMIMPICQAIYIL